MSRLTICCLIASLAMVGVVDRVQAQPRTPRPQPSVPEHFEGKVISVSATLIEIQKGKDPPVGFRMSDKLAKGLSPEFARGRALGSNQSYTPFDVKVGDIVEIIQDHDDRTFVCEAILIRRRPGGRVPEAPNEVFDPKRPQLSSAFRMNAWQDYEEKGIPLPDCLIPPWEKERIAPMPREVKPKTPAKP